MISDISSMGQAINRKIAALEDFRKRNLKETKKCYNCGRFGHVVRTYRQPIRQGLKYPK